MRILFILFFLFIAFSGSGQNAYDLLKERLQYGKYYQKYKDFESEKAYYQKLKNQLSEKYNIHFTDDILNLDTVTVRMNNPYDSLARPRSYSILFEGNVVSLMEPGYFLCYDIKSQKRNIDLEEKLNVVKHKKAYLLNKRIYSFISEEVRDCDFEYRNNKDNLRLIGTPLRINTSTFDVFNGKGWTEEKLRLPLLQNKVYEDSLIYIANNDEGEWGAYTYCYYKNNDSVHYIEQNSLCGVMIDSSCYLYSCDYNNKGRFRKVDFFNKEPNTIKDYLKWVLLVDNGANKNDESDFREYGFELSSFFNWRGKLFALVTHGNGDNYTFLTEYKNEKFFVVDPLFMEADFISTESSTSTDGSNVLINMGGSVKEIGYFLFTHNKVIRVIWE